MPPCSRIAITGGVATGKSTVLGIARDLGFTTQSADEIVRDLWKNSDQGTEWASALGIEFPINAKSVMRRLVDTAFRRRLAEVIHPVVFHRLLSSEAQLSEIPLLFESAAQSSFSRVIVVVCAPEVQEQRLSERISDIEFCRELIHAQLSSNIRVALADYVVDTSGSLEATKRQVESVLFNR